MSFLPGRRAGGPRSTLLAATALAMLVSGCSSPSTSLGANAGDTRDFSITYHATGKIPVYGSSLAFFTESRDFTVTFGAAGLRLDTFLRAHASVVMHVSKAGTSVDIARVFLDAADLTTLQVLVSDENLPPGFQESIFLRDATESSCIFGTAFMGTVPGDVISIPRFGGAPLMFSPIRKEEIVGRQATLYEADTDVGARYSLWIDPTIPCPLKGSLDGPSGTPSFSFAAVTAPTGRLQKAERTEVSEPRVRIEKARVGPYGIPPEGASAGRFPLQTAFERARTDDAGFRTWLRDHPAALMVDAKYSWTDATDLRRVEFWTLLFATISEGYEVKVQRHGVLKEAVLDKVTEASARQFEGGIPLRTVLADAGSIPTLAFYYDVQRFFVPSAMPWDQVTSLLSPFPLATIDYPRSTTSSCDLTACASNSNMASLDFDPVTGALFGFGGGFAAWEKVQR